MMPALPRTHEELAAIPAATWQALLAGPPHLLAPWLRAAADLDDVRAQVMLGQMLLDGRHVDGDATSAYRYFSAAARAGDAMACNMCGRCLEYGWGVAIDLVQAAAFYLQAAQAGLDWGMYNTATLMATGRGVQQDQRGAFTWYRRAAALGHAKSLNLVGRYLEEGLGGATASRARAFAYYRAAARGGDFRGQYSYACMLAERGRIDEALHWLQQIPAGATPAFMRKIGFELQLAPHAAFRALAQQLLERARAAH
jgi:TPR repeat protein